MSGFVKVLKVFLQRCWTGIKHNLDVIGVIVIFCSPFAQSLCTTTRSSVITSMLVIWIGFMLLCLDKGLYNKHAGIPVMRKRFVHYNKSSNIVFVKEEDWHEVVTYLADLQECFEKEGML